MLESQHPTRGDKEGVLIALIVLGTAVVSEPMLRTLLRLAETPGSNTRWFIGFWMGVVWLAALVGVLHVLGV